VQAETAVDGPTSGNARQPESPAPSCEPGFPAVIGESDGSDRLGLRSPIALRDVELDPLALFEGAVAIRLDGGEVDEYVPTTVDRDEAVALVRVEPFD
jgi:hypothetical protein